MLSIEAKYISQGKWECLTDNGREKTGLDVFEWSHRAVALGAGEILLTSVDREGTKKGFDCDLIERIASSVSVPVIAGGGAGKIPDLEKVIREGRADAVAIASILHYNKMSILDIKKNLTQNSINVRNRYQIAS
jgi:cyclase